MQVAKFYTSVFLQNKKGTSFIDDEFNNINSCSKNNIESISQSNIKRTISQNYDNVKSKEVLIADLRQENIQLKPRIAIVNEIPNKYDILQSFLLNEKSKGKSSIIYYM